ncbi:DUF1120 domain-containing protein [Achromobacter kerstersii]|uniref:DUF1120 domain-containing protein n=1 Tax=Achromobacter kerstersii TaxID=1353890 RepID=UPI0009E6DCB1|nr:DUF1120 domain-containing protein [Achromobacter kerstersii]
MTRHAWQLGTFMTTHLKLGIVLAALTAAAPAISGNNLTITGKLTPPACNVHFGSDSTFNFGVIAFNALDNNGTKLDGKDTALQIDCGSPTRVSVVAQDNRAGSGITIQEAPSLNWPYQNPENGPKYSWGLGFADGNHIKTGALIVLINPPTTTIDGTPLTQAGAQKIIARPTGSSSWSVASSHYSVNLSPNFEYSFGAAGGPPGRITNAKVALGLAPLIGQPSTLPSADEIPLDGSITFTLRYL